MNVDSPWHRLQAIGNSLREFIIRIQIATEHLNVNRGGQTEVQDLAYDVRGLEEEFRARKFQRQLFPKLLYIFGRWTMMLLVERNQNLGIRSSHCTARAVRGIDRAEGQSDIVDDGCQFAARNLFPQQVFDLIA